ncbi:DNA polymerase III subunit gamma/tau [Vitreoscilla filiformis]|uniref:DNA polymerase III subunit gamma/tau n=1 Tax=Vitreoscilla filiformis TaxID=63 RepID=A0A221KH89_VITFI|nr:DNA polymerase III subunit gamma/tau [Vitreoscilla filiformis]ASM78414.1 DNA polymerase III subunit gamma/tau [Vitreoscilla filiformis]
MSYVVLARKYRPHSFEQMVGQDHVVKALTHALQQQRLHHAYLFTGTRGIGKTTVSRILAKSLNCTGPDGSGGITAQPCGQCAACREIDADRYIDYVELDAASNRSIDEVRELIERAAYKPTVGRFKVFMIDEAHQLTKDAFNALLKTLEEPPEYLKFVLATTDPEKMLPTVLSRCLQFNLRPMAPQTVAEYVGQVLQAEQIAADAGALRLIGRAARGSMRDALSLTDQAIAYGGGKLEEDAVRAMLGAVDRRHAQRLVVALAQRNGREVLAQCDGLRSQGLSAAGTLEEMARLLQQMAVEQTVPGALDPTDPDTEAARELAPHLAADETQLLYSMVLHGRAELSLAPDEYAGLVMVLLRFLAFPPQESASRGNAAPVAARSPAPVMLPPPPPPLAAPVAAPVAVPLPSPTPVPMAAPVPAPVPPPPAPTPSVRASTPPDDDGPPPWMDEAPLPGEVIGRAPVRAASPAVPAPPPVPVPAPVAPPVVATVQALTTSPLGDHWAGLVMRLVSEAGLSAMARELALQAQLVAWPENDTDDWQLQVERDTLLLPALSDKLAQCLTQLLGRPQRVQVRQGAVQDSPARRAEALLRQRQHQAEQAIHDDVLVQVLLEQFSTARIVPGSIRPA